MSNSEYDVFLSHNSKDKDAVRKLKQRLEADGLKVWFDDRELQAGDELHKAIAEGLDQSRVCAVFIGSEGFGPWHNWEVGLAVTKHVNSPDFRLIPVVLPRESKPKSVAKVVPLELSNLLWVEFTKLNDDEPYQRLKDGILSRGSDFTPRAIRQIEEDTETNITPRGLRSFEEDDKHFFLRLVAGPRDHRGLPVSIAFWKNRLEQVDPDKTFRVGLLFGPSGCGKSSLVKAGLLPRLHQYVTTIYLAATPDRTEQQLLNAVRKQVPGLPSDLGLVESLAHLTSHPNVLKDCKLVIVLDQFEQWLHGNPIVADAPLIAALRHCDAAILQAVVMVRADFYVETHRLFEQLNGVKIQDNINADLIDLFDRDHARNVLLEYGRAYGRFTDPQSLNVDEETFLAETLDQLQDSDQRLVAVQLALFADLMKNKPWTGEVLKKLGGATGVGRAFLEENFDAKTANATHRFHRKAAVAVLKELLPPRGAGIKGTSKTKSELMQAASYQSRPADFEGLLGVLLIDLKLISPVACEEDSSSRESPANDPRFQLIHDYLVPSIREWLIDGDRLTRRGRARLLLEERADQWNRDPHRRHLPTLLELARLSALTPRRDHTEPQRKMLRAALQFYVRVSLLLLFAVGAPFSLYLMNRARFDALKYLGQSDKDDAGVSDALVALLKHPDSLVRSNAANSLVESGKCDAVVIEALVALAKDQNLVVRYHSAESLGKLKKGDVSVTEALVELLKEHDGFCQDIAANSLVKLGKRDTAVIDSLVALLNDPGSDVRYRAAGALEELVGHDPLVIDTLLALLKDQSSDVRSDAATSLVKLGNSDATVIEALVALLKDRDIGVSSSAALSLVQLGNSDAAVAERLIAILKYANLVARKDAAESSGKLKKYDTEVNEPPVALRNMYVTTIRLRAVKSLVQLGMSDSEVIDTLVALLKHPNSMIRWDAAEVSGKLEKYDTVVVEALIPLLKDQQSFVCSTAANSLVQLGKIDRAVINALVPFLEDQESDVRLLAAATLVQLGKSDVAVIDALVPFLKDQESDVRERAANALGQLSRQRDDWSDERMMADLADNDSSVRERAGIVLAYRRQKVDSELTLEEARRLKDIRDQVEGLRKDARPWVRQASLHALYHIEKRKAELEAEARNKAQPATTQSD